ncbi:MAG TPA: glucose 1-dehydrogenase [Acidimicrobiales bacterium]|nr:glucose 1-dehydrogenase [Acidimicrobiales bacterium]
MGRLDGKVALISGGARGQGAAEAKLFVAEGARVMIGDVLDAEGEVTAKELGDAAAFRHHDVTDEDHWSAIVAETVERFGRLDVLVNNAGVFRLTMLATTSLAEYRQVIEINQVGVFLGMRSVAATMAGQRRGSIINISSVAGLRGTMATMAYTASKFAVRGMTKVAAMELAPVGVRVNSIHPGIIDTPMFEEIAGMGVGDALTSRIPIGRIAEADDVAKMALFLASDDSAYCTGAEFVVDGGMTATF